MLNKLHFILVVFFLARLSVTSASICSAKNNTKCTYRISRLDETEYLIVKNILNNLLSRHWNITLEWLMFKPETKELKMCDQYFDHVAVNQVISKDFKHPNNLFKNVPSNKTNKETKRQYEIEWYEKYKMIKYLFQSERYLEKCNTIGLKLYFLLHEYGTEQGKVGKKIYFLKLVLNK